MAKILVVDDQAEMRWILTDLLQHEGFDVMTADDGLQAVQRIKEAAPQVVLLDLKMPRLDGMHVLAQMKECAVDTLVIVLTGHGDVPTAVHAMKLGAYDFLTKPFEPAALLSILQRALERWPPLTLEDPETRPTQLQH